MLPQTKAIETMVGLVQKYHSGQTRKPSEIPYWHHVVSVAEILRDSLVESGDVSPDEELFENILLAALGHDLYEDTAIDQKEIQEKFGEEVHQLIDLMTNKDGDHDREGYIIQIRKAPEAVKLIKLADLTENTSSAAQRLHELGAEWANTFFRPIIEEMSKEVSTSAFTEHRKTAAILWRSYDFSYKRLIDNIEKLTNSRYS